jgi:hypothetical protein
VCEVAKLRVARRLLLAFAMANTFETISTDIMNAVAGGVGASGTNDQLLSSLNGIQSSLDDLGKNRNSGGNFFSGSNGLMFMGMAAMAMSRRQQTTVVYGGRSGYYWQSSW